MSDHHGGVRDPEDPDAPGSPAAGAPDDRAAAGGCTPAGRLVDSVDAALTAQLDHLDGVGPWPDLSRLTVDEQVQAATLINLMQTGRGLSLQSSTPSLQALLAGTEFEPVLTRASRAQASTSGRRHSRGDAAARDPRVRADRILHALSGIDDRVRLQLEPHPLIGPAVTVRYLDLSAVFFAANADLAASARQIGEVAAAAFAHDATLDYLAVVAEDTEELLTQLVGPSDVSTDRIIVPDDQASLTWPMPQPIALALQQIMQFAAPQWDQFGTATLAAADAADLREVLGDIAQVVVSRETTRAYRGLKGQAYKSFAESAAHIADLLSELPAAVSAHGQDTEPDGAAAAVVERLMREAA